MANDYTTKTASIMATVGNIRKLKSRTFDSQEIKLNGTDIQELWGFQDPEDFNELVKRYNLPTDEDYIIWTDSGNVAHMSFADVLTDGTSLFENSGIDAWDISMAKLDNGYNMFKDTTITGFEGDVPSLVNGEGMFQGCTKLSLFDADLSSLRTGYGMFDSKLGNTSTTATTAETGEDDIEMTRCPLTPESIHKISGWKGSIDDVKDIALGYEMVKAIYDKTLPYLDDNDGNAGSIPYIKELDRTVDSHWSYNGGMIDADTDTVCKRGIIHMGYPHEPMTEDESKLVDVCFCYITGVKGWRLFIDGVEWYWNYITPPIDPPGPGPDPYIPHPIWPGGGGGGGGGSSSNTSRTIKYDRAWSEVNEYDTLIHPLGTPITSIINNVVSDGTVLYATLGATAFEGPTQEIISVSVLRSGGYHNSGMLSFTTIDTFDSPLTKLAHGTMMFNQCPNLIAFNSSTGIPKLQTANDMFNGCKSLPAFPTDSNNNNMKEFSSLKEAKRMFKNCNKLTSFTAKIPRLEVANEMFDGCGDTFVSFDITGSGGVGTASLDKLRLANKMFHGTKITSAKGNLNTTWDVELPELEEGLEMFYKVAIVDWIANLPNLKKNDRMFKLCESLETFSGSLLRIERAAEMFCKCTVLESVSTVVPRLRIGNQMFNTCGELREFNVPALPSLEFAAEMFQNTKLEKWERIDGTKLNLPKLRIANDMFGGVSTLKSFKGDIGRVGSDECGMFRGCIGLKTFEGNINNMIQIGHLFSDCDNLESFKGNLPRTINADEAFCGKTKFNSFESGDTHVLNSANEMFKETDLTTFYASDLNNLNEGQSMFEKTPIEKFTNTTNNLLLGNKMFKDCKELTTITTNFGSLEDGTEMFSGTTSLKHFSCGNMNNLEKASKMFANSGITVFASNMPNLIRTSKMFDNCTSLTSFKGNLNSIINHENMFNGCANLTTFSGNLNSLEYGTSMFEITPNLITFETNTLKNLKYGERMFYGTKLIQFNVEKEDTQNAEVQAMNLSALTDGTEMFAECHNLTKFEKVDLSSLENGTKMFYRADLTSFNAELTKLKNATDMFRYNSNLVSFIGDTSKLTTSLRMFSDCTSLKQFNGNLNSLTNSDGTGGKSGMFNECKNLESFKAEMPKLTTGYNFFFGCTKLSEFDCKSLSNMTMGYQMFCQCKSIKKISTKLDKLVNGKSFCHGCASLTEFDPGENGLKLLTNGAYMFSNCKLDADSVRRILENIPQFRGTHVSPSTTQHDTASGEGYLQIGMQASAISTFEEVTGLSVTVEKEPGYKNGILKVDGNGWMEYRGWKVGGWIANYFA